MLLEKTISDILFKIYSPAGNGSFFDHLLTVFEHYIPTAYSGYSFSCLNDKSYCRQVAHNLRDGHPVDLTGLNDMFQEKHPFWPYYMQPDTPAVLSTTDLIALDDWKQTEFYRTLSRPAGVIHDTSLRFYTGSRCVSYTFHGIMPITSEHKRLLNMIVPHLNNAYASHAVRLEGITGNLPENMMLISAEGKVEECSPAAIRTISSYYDSEPARAPQRLPESVEAWVEMNAKQSEHSTPWNALKPMRLTARRNGNVLLLRILRLGDRRVLTFEEHAVSPPYRILMSKGLTRREAEILLWTAQGNRNSEIATILGIRTSTVRKHMEHILLKLECENRGCATQRALEMIEEATGGCLLYKCMTCAVPVCRNCDPQS